MGIDDRPYWRDEQSGGRGGRGMMGGLSVGLPRPPKIVKRLLIINLSVFVLQLLVEASSNKVSLSTYFGATVGGWWQIWRYVTFQFLHSPRDLWHIALNMLGLYMLGSGLERHWGSRRFLRFYLTCGASAGLAYVLMRGMVGFEADIPLVGASGGVFGIVLACAVLFPHIKLIFFLFPVPIRLAAVIIFGAMTLIILRSFGEGVYGPSFWSHIAHLGGVVAAAVWVWILPRLQIARQQRTVRLNKGSWDRKMKDRSAREAETERILKKIHERGLNSLSRAERNRLAEATRRQQIEDRQTNRL